MLGRQGDDNRGILRALGLVDRYRVGVEQLVAFVDAVGRGTAVEFDRHSTVARVDTADVADVAVIDVAVVIVLDLHNLVAGAKVPRGLVRQPVGVQYGLENGIEVSGPQTAANHGTQHLDVAHRIKAKSARDPLLDDLADFLHPVLGRPYLDKIEILGRLSGLQLGQLTVVDSVRVDHDPANRRLAEHRAQAGDRNRAGSDDVRQHLARPDGGQLIDVADENERRRIGHRAHQGVHEMDVDHGSFIDDQDLAFERRPGIAAEAPLARIHHEKAVDGLGLHSGTFRQPLGGAAGRRREVDGDPFGPQNREDRVHQGCLSDPGTTGDDQDLRRQGDADRIALFPGQSQGEPFFEPRHGLVGVDRVPGRATVAQAVQTGRDIPFGPEKRRQKSAAAPTRFMDHDSAGGDFLAPGLLDHFRRDPQQLHGPWQQDIQGQAAMALTRGFGQSVGDSGPDAIHRRLGNAHRGGDRVGGGEADSADLSGQAIGIGADRGDHVGAVVLVDSQRHGRSQAVLVEENHDFSDRFLAIPRAHDPVPQSGTDAGYGSQALGGLLDDVENLGPEGVYELLRVTGTDSRDHAGGQILPHPVFRPGDLEAEIFCLELTAEPAVLDPSPAGTDVLARRDRGGVADDGDAPAVAANPYPQHRETIFGILEDHTLDTPGKGFQVFLARRGTRLRHSVVQGFAPPPNNELPPDIGPRPGRWGRRPADPVPPRPGRRLRPATCLRRRVSGYRPCCGPGDAGTSGPGPRCKSLRRYARR